MQENVMQCVLWSEYILWSWSLLSFLFSIHDPQQGIKQSQVVKNGCSIHLIWAQEAEAGRSLCEFKANLVYRPDKATKRDPVKKQKSQLRMVVPSITQPPSAEAGESEV